MKPGNLREYFVGLRSAAKFGVEPDYRKRYRQLRRQGEDERWAAERALRDAVNAVNPRAALGVTLSFKEGRS
jgi:hypothetical protein